MQLRQLAEWAAIKAVRQLPSGRPDWLRGPKVLQLDLHNYCNLSCIYCNVQGCFNLPKGYMKLATAKQALEETTSTARMVWLFLNGEPLLDRRLPTFSRLSKYINPKATTVIFTNGTVWTNRELLLDRNIDQVHFTISAATRKTYAQVHGRDLFEQALQTAFWFRENKNRRQKQWIHFVITNKNFHELEAWKQRFKGFNWVISPLHRGFGQQRSEECLAGINYKATIKIGTYRGEMAPNMPCTLWNNQSISWRGELLECCAAPYGYNHGIVGERHMVEAWNEKVHNRMQNPICGACSLKNRGYKMILKKWLA